MIYQLQLQHRRAGETFPEVLLLLQHRPVFTGGRRQGEEEMKTERERLENIRADFSLTNRGGQLTYHGPGQITGYPLLDLSRSTPPLGIRDYICLIQKSLERYLSSTHRIETVPSEHTGIFLDAHTKIGSIGVQVRHRLTTHGFALNVTNEPLNWFNRIVACGLDDVKAGSVESATGTRPEDMGKEAEAIVANFSEVTGREMVPLDLTGPGSIEAVVSEMEEYVARLPQDWATAPAP
jgi:lipoyl(octanoyl) transferase